MRVRLQRYEVIRAIVLHYCLQKCKQSLYCTVWVSFKDQCRYIQILLGKEVFDFDFTIFFKKSSDNVNLKTDYNVVLLLFSQNIWL